MKRSKVRLGHILLSDTLLITVSSFVCLRRIVTDRLGYNCVVESGFSYNNLDKLFAIP